ncbi:MAG: DUF5615 family PIN-like protein [Chloroflexota bacterium]
MKLLIDMNLSPNWVDILEQLGVEAVHWSSIGDARTADSIIMAWAEEHGYVVFTHDLDFGTLLATTKAVGPSVVQVRADDVLPQSLGDRLVKILHQYESEIESGALVTIDEERSRIRILPF